MQRPAPRARGRGTEHQPQSGGTRCAGERLLGGQWHPYPHSTEASLVLKTNLINNSSQKDGLATDLSSHLVLATYLPGDFRHVMNL